MAKKPAFLPKKILIIEEEGVTLNFLSNLLNKSQREIQTASCGHHAFEILENGFVPDCIVLAVNLAKMNGSDILLKLRMDSRWETIPVLPFYRYALGANPVAA